MESYNDKNKSSSLRNPLYSGLTSALKNAGKHLKKAAMVSTMYLGMLGCRSAYQGFENLPDYRQKSALTSLEYSLGEKPSVVADNLKKYIAPELPFKVDRTFEGYNWDDHKEKLGNLYEDVKSLKDATSVAANINDVIKLVTLEELIKEGGLTDDIKPILGKDATLDGLHKALTNGKHDGKKRIETALEMVLNPDNIGVLSNRALYTNLVKIENYAKKLDDNDVLKKPLDTLTHSYKSNLKSLFNNTSPLIHQGVAEGKYPGDTLRKIIGMKVGAYDALHSTKLIELGKKVYDILNVDGTLTTKESKNSLSDLLTSELEEIKSLFKKFPPHTLDKIVHNHRYKVASKLAELNAKGKITEEQQIGALYHLDLEISARSIDAGKSEDSILYSLIPGFNVYNFLVNRAGYFFVPDKIQYKTLEERLIHNSYIHLGNTNAPHEVGEGNNTLAIADLIVIAAQAYVANKLLKDKDKKSVTTPTGPTGPTGTGGENNGGPGGN